jgi:hypothetical protein
MDVSAPRPDDVDRMERALGWRPTAFRLAPVDRGPASRWIVAADAAGGGRRSAFVKIGATSLTADWTRTEARNYQGLQGWFLPKLLGYDDDGVRPALAIEDLSDADWPPPWDDARIAAVLDGLAAIHATSLPVSLAPAAIDSGADWRSVAADPAPFLSVGLCSERWLEAALPALIDTASSAPLTGSALVHLDIRSDNLCFREGRVVVIDWNHATLANPDLDVAFWLPSLQSEGGPPPEAILPDAPGLAAWVAGFFSAHAGMLQPPNAPHVRPLQLAQARTALPWAARALGLPAPG